jgi:hypothetical protein
MARVTFQPRSGGYSRAADGIRNPRPLSMSRYSGTAHPGLADGKNDKKLASGSGWPVTRPKGERKGREALPPSRNCIRPPGHTNWPNAAADRKRARTSLCGRSAMNVPTATSSGQRRRFVKQQRCAHWVRTGESFWGNCSLMLAVSNRVIFSTTASAMN